MVVVVVMWRRHPCSASGDALVGDVDLLEFTS